MPQTPITSTVLKLDNYPVAAGDLAIVPIAMDAVNGNSFASTGREILLFQNTDSVPHTITINSQVDNNGRFDTTLTNYSIPANSLYAIQMKYTTYWASNGTITLSTSSALIKCAVLQYT